MSSSLSASQHVFVQHQQKSSSSLSSRKNSSSSLTIQTTRRHSSKRGVITSSKVSSSQSDVITNNAVQIPTKPTGEPKVVYIFNSKTCDGGAELKDILGNKCVSFSLHPLNARELVTPRVRRNELTEGHVFFSFFEGEKNMSPFTTAKIQDQFFSYLNFFSLVFFFFRKRSIDEDTRMTFTNQFRLFLLLSFEKQTKQRRFVGGDDETGRSRAAGIYHSGVHVRDV